MARQGSSATAFSIGRDVPGLADFFLFCNAGRVTLNVQNTSGAPLQVSPMERVDRRQHRKGDCAFDVDETIY